MDKGQKQGDGVMARNIRGSVGDTLEERPDARTIPQSVGVEGRLPL